VGAKFALSDPDDPVRLLERRYKQMSQTKTIKPFEAFGRLPGGEVVNRGTAVVTKMTGNSNFQNPPVDLVGLKKDIDTLSALMAESLDGSKKVIAEKQNQKEVVVKKLRLLGRYVETNCKDDMAIFLTSGFEPASNSKAQSQGLSQYIRSLERGSNSGDVVVRLKAVPDAASYQMRYAALSAENGGMAPAWTIEAATGVRTPIKLTGLKPGTTYAFQVRSLGKTGYSDWSDSVTLMCT
jgi:hypothetical protein